MSMLSNVKVGSSQKPPVRVLIYGEVKIGKSTFGANAPNAIFISPESGTDEIENARVVPGIKTWDHVVACVTELQKEKHEYQTLVLDTADWLEKLAHEKIIGTSGKTIITADGGYGSGYRKSENMHTALIRSLSELRDNRAMNIIITAHQQVKPVKDPESAHDYDCFDIKCHELVSSLWREWVDCVLFARFKTYTRVTDEEKVVAVGEGERVLYTQARPSFRAGNRYKLPFELPLSWDAFIQARNGVQGNPELDGNAMVDEVIAVLKTHAVQLGTDLTLKITDALAKANSVAEVQAIKDRLLEITKGAA